MATKIASLAVEIGVDTSKLETGLKNTKTQLTEVGNSAKSLGDKVGSFAAGFGKFALEGAVTGLGVAFAASIKSASEFETSFGQIKGLTNTAAGDIDKLKESVLGMSRDLPVGANELAKGLYFISSSGYQGAEAMKILESSAKASAAGLGETKTIADAVTSALNAYGLAGSDAARITDLLTAAVVEGKGEPDQLAQSLGRVLPVAAAAGVSMEEIAASLSMMTRTGLSADESATALRGTIGALLAPAKQSKDALAELGISTEQLAAMMNSAKGGEGLVAVLDLLMQRTGGNIEMLDAIIPNIRALTGVLSSAGSQGEEYARVLGVMENAAGSTDKAFAAMADTMEFKLKKAQNSLDSLGIAITSKLLPGLGQAADAASTLINWQDKIGEAFTGTEQKIRTSAQSYAEYSSATIGVGRAAGLVRDVFRMGQGTVTEYAAGFKMLTEAEWDAAKASEEMTTRVAGFNALFGAQAPKKYKVNFGLDIQKVPESTYTAGKTNKEQIADQKALGEWYGALTEKAIAYTDAEKQMADLKEKLKKADSEILAAGQAQVGMVQNKKMSETEYAAALAKSAKIQEDLTNGARKKNETDAEYSSRMANLQVQLDKVNSSLGTHTGILGGATEAQLKNRDAIKEQIAALEEQDAKSRAMEGIDALGQSLKDGRITLEQYNERVTAINQRTGLYTESALAASLAQTAWIQAISSGLATQEQMDAALAATTDQLGLFYAALNLLPAEKLISIRLELANPELMGDIQNMGHPGGLGTATAPATPAPAPATSLPNPTRRGGPNAARGISMTVPPGYPHDSYPINVSSGEYVEVKPRGEQGGSTTSNTTNNISITIGAISKEYGPQQAGDEIVNRMRSRGLIA